MRTRKPFPQSEIGFIFTSWKPTDIFRVTSRGEREECSATSRVIWRSSQRQELYLRFSARICYVSGSTVRPVSAGRDSPAVSCIELHFANYSQISFRISDPLNAFRRRIQVHTLTRTQFFPCPSLQQGCADAASYGDHITLTWYVERSRILSPHPRLGLKEVLQ